MGLSKKIKNQIKKIAERKSTRPPVIPPSNENYLKNLQKGRHFFPEIFFLCFCTHTRLHPPPTPPPHVRARRNPNSLVGPHTHTPGKAEAQAASRAGAHQGRPSDDANRPLGSLSRRAATRAHGARRPLRGPETCQWVSSGPTGSAALRRPSPRAVGLGTERRRGKAVRAEG